MIKVQDRYGWEVETAGGAVLSQYGEAGEENPSTSIVVDDVVRASLIPRVYGLPRHDCLLDQEKGERFVRRFGRGFLKDQGSGVRVHEYLQCIVTTNYRLYVFSTSGRALVTRPDYEAYL